MTGWNHRKSHVINAATGAGTNYQVPIKVYKATSPVFNRTAKTDMTYARQYAQQGVIGGKIYVVGGRDNAGNRFNYNEEYDPVGNSWTTKTPYPLAEDAAGCGVLVDADSVTRFHVVCGYPDDPVVHKHYAYDPIDNDWTEYAAFPITTWDCGGVVINNKLYIFGGSSDNNVQSTIYEYDPTTNAWVQKTSMTYGRAKHAFSVHNGKIYVFCSSWYSIHTHVEVYDPVGNSWTTLNDAPELLICASKESIGGKIYIHPTFDDTYIYEYDPVTDTYDKILTTGLYGYWLPLESVVIGTKFYVIGGDYVKKCWEEEITTSTTDSAEKVHFGGNCRDDFGDVRFTDNDGDTLLDCWMESKVDSNYAIFWVEVADSLETDPQTIYVYYDKASATYPYLATAKAQGIATFLLFDDFTTDTSADWTNAGGEFSIDTANQRMIITGHTNEYSWIKNNKAQFTNCLIRAKLAWHTKYATYPQFGLIGRMSNINTGYIAIHDSANNWRHYDVDGGWIETQGTNGETLNVDTYYIFEFSFGTASPLDMKCYKNNLLRISATDASPSNANYAGIFGERNGRIIYAKEFYVRKYVTTEPAHSTWGTEENAAVDHYITVTEYIGGLDSYSRNKSYFRTVTELLGVLDTKTRVKSYYRTITEAIGALDTKSRTKTIYRAVTEPLGLKDSKTRSKTINRIVTELLGLKDIVTKVAWHWSLPPIPPVPPVITAAVGKIKQILLDKFLGWLEQPAEDNPRVQCDVEVSWTQTNRVASSIKNFFTETVTIKAKVAHVFTETMPITAAILHEFTESVQIRSGIIQKFEETRNITADLMKAVIEDGFKVFGEVTPLLEKLRELRRKIEDN